MAQDNNNRIREVQRGAAALSERDRMKARVWDLSAVIEKAQREMIELNNRINAGEAADAAARE